MQLKIKDTVLELPVFFPDATRGVVRSTGTDDVCACGIQGLMVNVFHLLERPGMKTIQEHGGMRPFMNWPGAIAVDSGGYQVYSLLQKSPDCGSVTKKGFLYRDRETGDKNILTPEKCVQSQMRLDPEILFCLDYCTSPEAPAQEQQQSVSLTLSWAQRCKETFEILVKQKKLPENQRPLLFAVVQGGESRSLREECFRELEDIGFDGFGYGGFPVTKDGSLSESVSWVADMVGDRYPLFGLGIGKPENIVQGFRTGFRMFDCVIPTRDARHQRLYTFSKDYSEYELPDKGFYDCLYMQDGKHARNTGPVEPGCDCYCCRNFSRSYLYHLFKIKDMLAFRLATIHNLRFYVRLMDLLRKEL